MHTATLHKPHVLSHAAAGVRGHQRGPARWCCWRRRSPRASGAFVHTSTTSAFGRALTPAADEPGGLDHRGRRPAATEHLRGHEGRGRGPLRARRSATTVCRAWCCARPASSRSRTTASTSDRSTPTPTLKVNELLYRRIDLADVVAAHLAALGGAPRIGFGRYVVSATTPFAPRRPGRAAPGRAGGRRAAVPRLPRTSTQRLGWRMFPRIDRVYVNARARADLGWEPRYDFRHALELLRERCGTAQCRSRPAWEPRATTRRRTGPYTTR